MRYNPCCLLICQFRHFHLAYRKIILFNEANNLSKFRINIRFYHSKGLASFDLYLTLSEFIAIVHDLEISREDSYSISYVEIVLIYPFYLLTF